MWLRFFYLMLGFFLIAGATQADALNLTGLQLRKTHGAAGTFVTTVDRNQGIAGAITVESRAPGMAHQLVFQFDAPLTNPGTVTVTDEGGAPAGLASASVESSTKVVVLLSGVGDNKRVTVRLANVDGQGLDFTAAIGFLIGDVNGSRDVDAADVAAIKARGGQVVVAANAAYDLNGSGVISAADIAAAKARSARTLPVAYTLGGNVSGLTGTLTLQNNGADNLRVSTNGVFVFPAAVGGGYNVTVSSQPAGQLCAVFNGAGTIAASSMSNVAVTCTTGQPTFGPSGNFIREGDSSIPTFPVPLTVNLCAPSPAGTFINVTSSSVNLQVVGGGVTIPPGSSSAPVLLSGIAADTAVTLTAFLPSGQQTATVRVLGATETPTLVSLTTPTTTIASGGTATFTIGLDIPAPAMGTTVSLSMSPSNAGATPISVTIPAGQTSAIFQYADASTATSVQVSATFASVTLTSTLTILASGSLMINEVDYDNVGVDSAEYIELLNTSGSNIDLSNLSIFLVNGSNNSTYNTISLAPAGVLGPGAYLVIGPSALQSSLPPGTKFIAFASPQDNMQNGAPDGIALANTVTGMLIDSLSYEGAMTAVTLTGLPGTFNLVQGTALPAFTADSNTANGTLCRMPNGTRTNNDATDWQFCSTPTPGAANTP